MNAYETADLWLASVLVAHDYPMVCMKRFDDQKYVFLFTEDNEIDSIVKNYWDRQLKMEPQSLFEIHKSLKSRIYADRFSK